MKKLLVSMLFVILMCGAAGAFPMVPDSATAPVPQRVVVPGRTSADVTDDGRYVPSLHDNYGMQYVITEGAVTLTTYSVDNASWAPYTATAPFIGEVSDTDTWGQSFWSGRAKYIPYTDVLVGINSSIPTTFNIVCTLFDGDSNVCPEIDTDTWSYCAADFQSTTIIDTGTGANISSVKWVRFYFDHANVSADTMYYIQIHTDGQDGANVNSIFIIPCRRTGYTGSRSWGGMYYNDILCNTGLSDTDWAYQFKVYGIAKE